MAHAMAMTLIDPGDSERRAHSGNRLRRRRQVGTFYEALTAGGPARCWRRRYFTLVS